MAKVTYEPEGLKEIMAEPPSGGESTMEATPNTPVEAAPNIWDVFTKMDPLMQQAFLKLASPQQAPEQRVQGVPTGMVDKSRRPITPEQWEEMPPGSVYYEVGANGEILGSGKWKEFTLDWAQKHPEEWKTAFCNDPEQQYVDWNGIEFEMPFGEGVYAPNGAWDIYENNFKQHKETASGVLPPFKRMKLAERQGFGGLPPGKIGFDLGPTEGQE